MFSVAEKYVLMVAVCLLGIGQSFGDEFWADNAVEPANSEEIDGKLFYSITTAEELAWLSVQSDPGKKIDEVGVKFYAVLKNDIDLAGKIWIPICPGGGNRYFNGIFDGNGFTIKNMTMNSELIYSRYLNMHGNDKTVAKRFVQNFGFVGTLGSGTIKNLNLKDISYSITNSSLGENQISVGAVVGWKSTKGEKGPDNKVINGEIDFCSASGTINTSGMKQGVGGLVGNAHSSTIKNSISYVNIIASGDSAFVGGIVGLTKNNEVKIESCVYAGETLISTGTGATVGAVAGKVVSGKGVNPTNTYYDDGDMNIPAVGNKKNVSGVTETDALNSPSVVCNLNGGTWDTTNAICNNDTLNYWSEGLSGLSLNGSDGYKITFDANGGSFDSGAKTSKILADGETITADEIATPKPNGKKFAGWATTAFATEPETNLGVADASKKIFAVWYDFYDVTFHWNSQTHTNNVAKHGVVSVDGFAVPKAYESDSGKYYFTGWAYEAKWFKNAEYIVQSTDTVRLASIDVTQDIDLFAVWTKARTLSVTFNATLHGENDVQIVRIVNEGDKASEPDTIITDPGYRLVGWYTDAACTAGNEYDFDLPLEDDLVLYAKWEVVVYTISYEMNGGTNAASNPTTYTINSDDIVLENPTKEGASFEGWFYKYENGVFSNRATQISKGSSENKTLYAKWSPYKYTIHYLSGGRVTGIVSSDEKEYGVSIQLKGAVDKFAIPGCSQDGWSKVELGDKNYDVGGIYEGNEDLMLYPHWVCNEYNITYDLLNGTGIATNHKNNKPKYQGPAAMSLANAYDSQKRIFMDNWYLEPTFITSIRYVQDIDADLTVYARWYNKIVYKPGSVLMANGLSAKDSVIDKKDINSPICLKSAEDLKKYTLANYTLDGWSIIDGGDKVYDVGEEYTANENLTLYPHWVENREVVLQSGAVTVYQYATDGRKEAVINGEYDGSDAVEITSDVTVSSVTLNRSFNVNKISTLYVPFEIPTVDVKGASIYKFNTVERSTEDGRWKFRVATTETVKPNTPYVVLPSASQVTFDISGSETLNGSVTLNTTTAGENTSSNHWEFNGVYAYTVFTLDTDNPIYLFANQECDGAKLGQFVRIKSGAWTNPMRAYLVYHKAAALSKSVSDNLGGNMTLPDELDIVVEDEKGIVVETGTLNTVTGEFRMDRWFDLKGRRLNSKPTVKGTYYKNGKKVIIK